MFRIKPMDIVVQTIWKEIFSNCTQEKKKLRIVQYLNDSSCVSFSSWNQVQIAIKLGRKHAMYEKFASFT